MFLNPESEYLKKGRSSETLVSRDFWRVSLVMAYIVSALWGLLIASRQGTFKSEMQWAPLTLSKMGFFGATHGWGGGKKVPPS